MQGLSQYPLEAEFLLPMFSMLEVVGVSPVQPVEIRCRYRDCLMPENFRRKCLADLSEAQRALDEIARAAIVQNPTLAPFVDPRGVMTE